MFSIIQYCHLANDKKLQFSAKKLEITEKLNNTITSPTILWPSSVSALNKKLEDFVRLTIYCPCAFLCLQCFDTVGWAAGRASGL